MFRNFGRTRCSEEVLGLTEEELIDQKLKIWSGSKTPSVYMKYLN